LGGRVESSGGFDDCKLVKPSVDPGLVDRAKDYFLREVGAEIASMSVTEVAYCKEGTFVVLEAETKRGSFPAQWLVSIRPGPPERWDLVRPE
jgi:hypothetical protein